MHSIATLRPRAQSTVEEMHDPAGGMTWYVELQDQRDGHHGHMVDDAYHARVMLVAHNKGGLSREQVLKSIRDQAESLALAIDARLEGG